MEREIEASTAVRAPLEWARRVLVDDPGAVLCDEASPEDRAARRFRTALSLDTAGAAASVRHDVIIDVGMPLPDEDGSSSGGVRLPLSWRAAGFERLFPTFDGVLAIEGSQDAPVLSLRGRYVVPLGPMGRFGDGLIGRRIARRSLAAFLESSARRLDEAVRRAKSASDVPLAEPYSVAFRER